MNADATSTPVGGASAPTASDGVGTDVTPMKATLPITLIEAITQALAWEIAHDDSVVVLGEAVGVNGGAFRATAGLQQRFGSARILDTQLDASCIRWSTM